MAGIAQAVGNGFSALGTFAHDAGNFFTPQPIKSPIPTAPYKMPVPAQANGQVARQGIMAPSAWDNITDAIRGAFNTTPAQPQQHQQLSAFHQAVMAAKSAGQTADTAPQPFEAGQAQAQEQPKGYNPLLDGFVNQTPEQYTPIIKDAALQYGVPTSILSGLLSQESMSYNPDVISGKINSPVGAQGIAQFMPSTAQGMGVNPYDVKSAIHGAARLLAGHYKQFGSWDKALAAYNAGVGAVQQYGGVPPYPETQGYVKNILNNSQNTYGSSQFPDNQ